MPRVEDDPQLDLARGETRATTMMAGQGKEDGGTGAGRVEEHYSGVPPSLGEIHQQRRRSYAGAGNITQQPHSAKAGGCINALGDHTSCSCSEMDSSDVFIHPPLSFLGLS